MATGTYNNCTFNITINKQPKLVLVKEIPVYNHGVKVAIAIVDAKHYEMINQYRWYLKSNGYVFSTTRIIWGKQWNLSNFVMLLEGRFVEGLECDHNNRNKLDNRVSNLDMVTPSENLMNRAKLENKTCKHFRGVSWCKRDRKWCSSITYNRESINLGGYDDQEEAAIAYDIALAMLPRKEKCKNYNFQVIDPDLVNQKVLSKLSAKDVRSTNE